MTPPSRRLRHQVGRFALVGLAGTAACFVVYLLARTAMPAQAANLAARVVVIVPTTWLHGRYAFGEKVSRRRLCGGALAVLAIGSVTAAGLLALEQAYLGLADRAAELAALGAAHVLATGLRFVLLRQVMFRRPELSGASQVAESAGAAGYDRNDLDDTVHLPMPASARATALAR